MSESQEMTDFGENLGNLDHLSQTLYFTAVRKFNAAKKMLRLAKKNEEEKGLAVSIKDSSGTLHLVPASALIFEKKEGRKHFGLEYAKKTNDKEGNHTIRNVSIALGLVGAATAVGYYLYNKNNQPSPGGIEGSMYLHPVEANVHRLSALLEDEIAMWREAIASGDEYSGQLEAVLAFLEASGDPADNPIQELIQKYNVAEPIDSAFVMGAVSLTYTLHTHTDVDPALKEHGVVMLVKQLKARNSTSKLAGSD